MADMATKVVTAEMGYCPVCVLGSAGSCDERCEVRVARSRALISRIGRRIETVVSDRIYDAGVEIIEREWACIERLVGHRVAAIPTDLDEPMRLVKGQVA